MRILRTPTSLQQLLLRAKHPNNCLLGKASDPLPLMPPSLSHDYNIYDPRVGHRCAYLACKPILRGSGISGFVSTARRGCKHSGDGGGDGSHCSRQQRGRTYKYLVPSSSFFLAFYALIKEHLWRKCRCASRRQTPSGTPGYYWIVLRLLCMNCKQRHMFRVSL